ncbi:anaphase-promoting complex subunit 10 family protein [Adhaeribacter rhizoryzae]|uniref:Carbohydrate-binding protein n=1 Tax=Adhaeribacter rhizoryzae TaxID=2607907 RepID=A0A5M6DB87_9BACT|nr:hypothetical protein [Adhaeribacter rhizoryzae]KAA5544824.1 hypothetical protein F0145_14170 [Adhaeribacter rhizoryzae]
MEKQLIHQQLLNVSPESWLDLAQLAQVELTSEDEAHPIELAFTPIEGEGWRASRPGEQRIRFLFDEPQNVKQIQLFFREEEQARTQEFLLRWLPAGAKSYQEIVRQQYNFSPPHTIAEVETYNVDLKAMRVLELQIIPDLNKTNASASLALLRLS